MARHGDEEGKVYVGGLPSDATAEEVCWLELDDELIPNSSFTFLQLDEAFGRYGRLRKVWVARRPPGFAFIQFDDIRDAEDAVRALDGRCVVDMDACFRKRASPLCSKICGVRARVELSHGRGRGGGRGYRDDRGGRDYHGGYRGAIHEYLHLSSEK